MTDQNKKRDDFSSWTKIWRKNSPFCYW